MAVYKKFILIPLMNLVALLTKKDGSLALALLFSSSCFLLFNEKEREHRVWVFTDRELKFGFAFFSSCTTADKCCSFSELQSSSEN